MSSLNGDGSGGIDAAEAFSVLGNETRIDVLRALFEADGPMSYAELRRAVAPDDRGNFHYHLDKLTGHFVAKTDDGYELRVAGERVVRAVVAGTLTQDRSIASTTIDERCAFCDAPVEFSYDDEHVRARCTACGGVAGGFLPEGTYMHHDFPPAGLDGRTAEEIVDAAHILYDGKILPMLKGVCPYCAGETTVSHDVCDEHAVDDESGLCPRCDSRFAAWSTVECERCRYRRRPFTAFAALEHPATVAFFHDHGLDERLPFRKLTADNGRFVRNLTTTVLETDPYLFRVTVEVDGEQLRCTIAEDFEVRSVERRPAAEGAENT